MYWITKDGMSVTSTAQRLYNFASPMAVSGLSTTTSTAASTITYVGPTT